MACQVALPLASIWMCHQVTFTFLWLPGVTAFAPVAGARVGVGGPAVGDGTTGPAAVVVSHASTNRASVRNSITKRLSRQGFTERSFPYHTSISIRQQPAPGIGCQRSVRGRQAVAPCPAHQ